LIVSIKRAILWAGVEGKSNPKKAPVGKSTRLTMRVEILSDASDLAERGAERIADAARRAADEHGRFHLAVSGGRTPWAMLERLSGMDLPWPALHLWQVDERRAPRNDPARNWTHICSSLIERVRIPAENLHPMPVDEADFEAAAERYARELADAAGRRPILDFVHLGLGADGHTASLVPDDPVLEVRDRDVAITSEYQGRRRMTLTYPALERARRILFLVAGHDKAEALRALRAGDARIPAGRLRSDRIEVLADSRAASGVKNG